MPFYVVFAAADVRVIMCGRNNLTADVSTCDGGRRAVHQYFAGADIRPHYGPSSRHGDA